MIIHCNDIVVKVSFPDKDDLSDTPVFFGYVPGRLQARAAPLLRTSNDAMQSHIGTIIMND